MFSHKMPPGKKVPILPAFQVKWLHNCSFSSARNYSPGLLPLSNVITARQGRCFCTSGEWQLVNTIHHQWQSFGMLLERSLFFLFQIIMHKTVWIKIFEIRSFTSDPLLQLLVDPAEMPGKLSINPFRIGFPLHQRTLHEGFYVLTKVLCVDTIRCKVLMPASPHCISPKLITDGSLWK